VSDLIHQHAVEALEELAGSEPNWTVVSDHWLKLSLASKGTSWEATAAWLGDLLRDRDSDALREGLTAVATSRVSAIRDAQ
jgi:hypothetical protein